ncbi:MAG: hypothetical protein ACFCUM_17070 [Bacteroidales bacterium]
MTTNYKLDKVFGPVGTAAGFVLIIAGLIMSYQSPIALILVVIGGFIGFTDTSSVIDLEGKRIRMSNNIFGFIRTGKWMNIEPDMRLGIERQGMVWRSYSRSNRSISISNKDVRIYLYDSNNRKVMPVMKHKTYQSARTALMNLSQELGLKVARKG